MHKLSEPGKRKSERFPLKEIETCKSICTQTSNILTNFNLNNKPKLKPLIPYHERLLKYQEVRNRIFCEEFTLKAASTKSQKRDTKRLREFWKKVVSDRRALKLSIDSIERIDGDIRPYIKLELFGMNLLGLIDTGASITCISGLAARSFLDKDIPYKRLNEFVTAAGGKRYHVLGYLYTSVKFHGLQEKIRVYIIPDLKQDLYLGFDFVKTFNLMRLDLLEINSIDYTSLENCHDLTSLMRRQLDDVIKSFPSYERDGLGKTSLLEHSIEISKDSKPVKQRYFSVSPAIEKLIHAEVDNMLAMDVIEVAPPNCPWSSPVTLVRKNGKSRLCLDSRRLNAVTVRDAYPQTKISNILARLPKAEFITSLDLKHAFWQIGLAPDSRDMTAFTIPNRPLYRYKVMPFGLTNAPQTMSRLMDIIIPATLRNQVFIYLDDLLLISRNFKEHLDLLSEVANILRKSGLTLNIAKCKWCLREVRYLGYIIGNGVIKTDPEKISAIRDLPAPKSVREVRKFLGLASWYRRFIDNFSGLTAPISDLTKKTKTFVWTQEANEAFENLKICLTSAPVLITPNFDKPFIIQCDASKLGIGGVLAQEDTEGVERPIAFYSYKLNQAQKNYSITELECLAALKCIEKFREYVEGHTFKVVTDHASLQWLMRQTDLNGRLARWSLRLQGFDFSIEHRKGSLQTVPDALSRLSLEAISPIEVEPEIDLQSPSFDSAEYSKLRNSVLANENAFPDLKVIEKFVYKRTEFSNGDPCSEATSWKLWVPFDLISEVIRRAHSLPNSSHGGVGKTLEKIRRNLFWPKMSLHVRDFISKCEICKQSKAPNIVLRPLMGNMIKSERPFQRIYMDFLGPYPRSKMGHVGILVILDHLTKYPILRPVKKFTSMKICSFIETHVFHSFGVPEFIVTDNGTQFKSVLFENLLNKYGVQHIFTAVYSPQSNSSERLNRSILAAVRSYLKQDQREWDSHLGYVSVALRSLVHTSIGYSPYHVLFGHPMITHGKSYELLRAIDSLEDGEDIQHSDKLQIIRENVKKNLESAYNSYQKSYNLRSKPIEYKVGDEVYRRNFVLSCKPDSFNAKLAPKFIKCRIDRRIGNCYYEISNLQGKKIGTYHAKDLRPI